jgi:hypothetical protein
VPQRAVGGLYNNLVGKSLEMYSIVRDRKAKLALIIGCA